MCQYYRENANYLERTYDFVVRMGIEKIRKETVYAPAAQKKALLRRLQKSKALSRDAWLERTTNPNHGPADVEELLSDVHVVTAIVGSKIILNFVSPD